MKSKGTLNKIREVHKKPKISCRGNSFNNNLCTKAPGAPLKIKKTINPLTILLAP